jgi:hypothetical protein
MTEPFVFDWHQEPRGGFLKWMATNLITGIPQEEFERLSLATDQWRSVELTVQINGHPVSTESFVKGVESNMTHIAKSEARRLLSEAGRFEELDELVRDVEREVTETIRRRLAAAGVTIDREEG